MSGVRPFIKVECELRGDDAGAPRKWHGCSCAELFENVWAMHIVFDNLGLGIAPIWASAGLEKLDSQEILRRCRTQGFTLVMSKLLRPRQVLDVNETHVVAMNCTLTRDAKRCTEFGLTKVDCRAAVHLVICLYAVILHHPLATRKLTTFAIAGRSVIIVKAT